MRGHNLDPDENEAFSDENNDLDKSDDFDLAQQRSGKEQIAKSCRGCNFTPILQSQQKMVVLQSFAKQRK